MELESNGCPNNCTSSSSESLLVSANPNVRSDCPQKRKAGRKKFRETRHPVYRGVRQRNGNRWVCEIREPNKKSRIWVGTYPTPEMAGRAHDVAVLALLGPSAKFNFPDSVSLLPLPKSTSAIHIREAAKAINITAAQPFMPNAASHNGSNFAQDGNALTNHHSQTMFFDEEALYNMPALLDSMAEGLLITPPSAKRPMDWDHVIDLTLWTN